MGLEMNTFWALALLLAGLLLLWKCADFLVTGAVGLAERLGISPLVVGLTVVAMGTSAPEVAASVAAAIQDKGNLALGNVYGSNIANLAMVGGICAMIRPIGIRLRVQKYEIPVMLLVQLLLFPLVYNRAMSRPEGIFLLLVFLALMVATVIMARRETHPALDKPAIPHELTRTKPAASMSLNMLLVLGGLIGLAVGAKMSVTGAVFIGRRVGLSEAVIGLTIIALGTSLPELVTCVVAAMKGQDDISIGNLVGSNMFNTLLVTGAAGVVRPFEIEPRLAGNDYWMMMLVSGVFALMAIRGKRIGRISGLVLLCGYLLYVISLLAGLM